MKTSDIKKDRINNTNKITIDLSPIYTADEIIKIIYGIENSYGGIDEIICLNVDDDNQIKENKRFETLSLFDQEFNDDIFLKSSKYIIKTPYLSKEFIIDRDANELVILTSEKTDDMGIKYYIVDDSSIFKREEKTENFYRLDKETKEWNRVPTMIGYMNDGTFRFVEISKEEVDNYILGKSK